MTHNCCPSSERGAPPGKGVDVSTARARARASAVLDVRDPGAFAAGHLSGAGNIPLAELASRRPELPPRDQCILVVASDPAAARETSDALTAMGFIDVAWLDGPLDALEGGLASRDPAARMWRPAPFLEEVLPLLPRGRTADVASGAGREAVFLALNGFEVEAWDADAEALTRARALAARHGVTIRTMLADVEATERPTSLRSHEPITSNRTQDAESAETRLGADTYEVIVCFRFLHRPLFPHIARALRSGGMLVYETYRAGQERFGKPRRPRFLLEPEELKRAFADLEILRYEEPSPPGGPLTARLLARKRGPSHPEARPLA